MCIAIRAAVLSLDAAFAAAALLPCIEADVASTILNAGCVLLSPLASELESSLMQDLAAKMAARAAALSF